jgi:hypothetical protein
VSGRPAASDPFLALGLERRGELADDDIRAAWRRVAAATHPDRADGGDPAAFAAAAAAYTLLRTPAGRGEALADLLAGPAARQRGGRVRLRLGMIPPRLLLLAIRVRRGRPLMLALRIAGAAVITAGAVALAGWQPASVAILTGALTWLILTGRADLAPPPA